jgi:signal transduction histidine kinase
MQVSMVHSSRLGGIERQQRDFVRLGRPGAALTALIVFAIYDLLDPSIRMHVLLGLLVLAVVMSGLGVLALRRWPVGTVARVTLGLDIVLIAVMIAVLGADALLVVPFYAPVAFGALLFGPVETAIYTVMGVVAGIVVGPIIDATTVTIVASCLVLAITGAILAGLSYQVHAAQKALAVERAADAAALRITERIRSSLDVGDVLQATVEELGPAVGVDRCILRLAPRPDASARAYEWRKPGLAPVVSSHPPAAILSVFETRRPVIVPDADAADKDVQGYLRSIGSRSMIAYPVEWHGRVIAAVGFADASPRDWTQQALPLLERVVPQLGAAVAQAEVFAEQEATLAFREELVANVSHELRTPLTSTIGFLRTLERPDVEFAEEQRARFLSTARTEAERLAGLVDGLLDLTRLQRGIFPLNPRCVEVDALVAQATLGLSLPEGREFRADVPAALLALADPDRLVQVLSNLLSNAAKHGGGSVVVTGAQGNGEVRLEVSDDGPGVPAERVADLFVPFARWGGASDSTGLGLAISRGIVEAHGGSLEYRPAETGNGHAFVVTLPRGDR